MFLLGERDAPRLKGVAHYGAGFLVSSRGLIFVVLLVAWF
jgi:hypothetical protein